MNTFANYVCLDLETTGLEAKMDDIIEIAMIKVRDGKIIDRWESFVYTPLEISQHVSYLTGIVAKDVKDSPDFRELIPKIEEFIGDDPLVGHNIWFDWNFLMQKGAKVENNPLWDTYIFSNILYPELPSHSLETNTKYFGISHVDSHRAMADVLAAHELWQILIDTFPEIDTDQSQKIAELAKKSSWPLIDFFTVEKEAKKHQLEIPDTQYYHPRQLELDDLGERDEHLFIFARGYDPVDLARSIETKKKTLFIAGYDHTLKKLQQVFPEAIILQPPSSYFSDQSKQQLWQKEELDDAESTLLLKTILYPQALSKEELILSHPERGLWKKLQPSDQEQGNESYQKMLKASLQGDQVITSHFQVLNNSDYLENFDTVVILEPHLLEANATRCFGQWLSLEQWLQQSDDENWRKEGESLFTQIDRLGHQLVPASPYPEHVTLTDFIVQSNEFIRLKSAITELVAETTDDKLQSYLKYYQAFFCSSEASWIRWITIDPRRGVSLNIAPLSVKSLLEKHLFQKSTAIVISDTAQEFGFLPEMETVDKSAQQKISVQLPDLEFISGSRKEGDHQVVISYLAAELPKLKGKTGVIFSSKAVLKRYFFDLVKVMPEEVVLFGEDISGGIGKLQDRYLSSDSENKVMFLSYRSLRIFPSELLDFDQILLQCLPFDPPGFPVHQTRSALCDNAFMDYALPRTMQNLLEILTNFTQREGEKKFFILDRRVQEKGYGEDILNLIQ